MTSLEQRMAPATEARSIGLVSEVAAADEDLDQRLLADGRQLGAARAGGRNRRWVLVLAVLALAAVGCADAGRATGAEGVAAVPGSTAAVVSTTVGSVLDDAGTMAPTTGLGTDDGDVVDLGGTFRFRVDPPAAGPAPLVERRAAIDTALATATSSGLETEGVEVAVLGTGELDKTDGTMTTLPVWLVYLRLPPTCASAEPCTSPSENLNELGVLIDAATGETLELAVLPVSGR